MHRRTITAIYVVVLLLLGGADALLTRGTLVMPTYVKNGALTGGGITPKQDPDVSTVLNAHGIVTAQASEQGFLDRTAPKDVAVRTSVLVSQGDRVGFLAYVDSPKAKIYFAALKQAIFAVLSPQATGISDVTETPEDRPVANILKLKDPSISEEGLLFVRVRQRLYEFHIAPGKESLIDAVVKELTE